MNGLTLSYVDFYPNKVLKEAFPQIADEVSIHVFSHKKGKRVYKKSEHIGWVIKSKNDDWCFAAESNVGFSDTTLIIVARFLKELNCGHIKFVEEKGELIYEKR